MNTQKHFCCPQCGNRHHLQITTQTDVNTTGKSYSAGKGCLGYFLLGPLGLLCGACGSGQKTMVKETKYWACPNCGNKFESQDDLRARAAVISKTNKLMIGLDVFILVMGVLIHIFANMADDKVPPVISVILAFVCLVVLFGAIMNERSGKKLIAEAETLESSMQRFAGYNVAERYVNHPVYVQSVQPAPEAYSYTCLCGRVNSADVKFCPFCGRANTIQ